MWRSPGYTTPATERLGRALPCSTTRVRCIIDKFADEEGDGELLFMDVGEGRFYSLKETGIRTWKLTDEGAPGRRWAR